MSQYPFDDTGLSPVNVVSDELHTVTELNYRDFHFIVPQFAPFFETGFVVEHLSETNTKTTLVAGVDYTFALEYLGATRALGTPVYGGITLASRIVTGVINLKSYQTVGGIWIANRDLVLKALSDLVYNPRITTWDLVTNVQQIFPPSPHRVKTDDLSGMREVVMSIDRLASVVGSPENRQQTTLNTMTVAAVKADVVDLKRRITQIESRLGI